MEATGFLCLMNIRGIGRRTAWSAVLDEKFNAQGPSDIKDWLETQSQKNKRITVPDDEDLERAWTKAIDTIEISMNSGITVICGRDEQYPDRLKRIGDPPPVLFAKGNVDALNGEVSIAIIGTREPTEFGEKSGHRIAAFLACSGAVIVSGLARGCDTTGHRGCLDAGGKTVAVLAHGLDSVHPKENTTLANEIVTTGGCLVSEYATGTRPSRNFFVERDRLQSGLSDGVIVIETGVKGGTLHTARFCLEQRRRLAVVMHIDKWQEHEKAQGNKMLLKEGKAVGLADKGEVNQFLQLLQDEKLNNAHCDHWMDDKDQRERQLSLL